MRFGVGGAVAAAFIMLIFVAPGCQCQLLPRTGPLTDTIPVVPHDTIAASVKMTIDNFAITETVGNEVKFTLKARQAQQLLSGDLPLQQMTVIFYNAGKESLELRADSGVFHGTQRDITLQGNVVATGLQSPVRFFTDALQWINAREVLQTASRVRVERDGMIMTGTGLVADKTLQRLELQRDIMTELQ
ncbi:MAG TPA: LPS export ABC transporter periplasmic protein LptC [bacterium]|nr:LPS export ABC transporter periplasmic protein LptC [bacterium]